MMRSCRRFLFATLLSTLACSSGDPPGRTGGKGGGAGEEDTGGSAGAGKGGTGGGKAGSGGSGGTGGMAVKPDAGPDGAPAPGDGGTCAPASSLLCNPTGKMPKSIKDTGLFPMAPDLTKHSPRMIPYVPDPPLWSDGLEKDRLILLPEGQKIDNTTSRWVFPIGTIFIKTFLDDSGAGGKPRAIETRFIRRVGDENAFTEYDFYLYEWNAAGDDATLLVDDRNGSDQDFKNVKVTINHTSKSGTPLKINGGMPFDHTLPSRAMCGDCHTENGVTFQTFIGFDQVRLDKTQLQAFDDLFKVKGKPSIAIADTTPPNPLLLKAKRFVFGNCVHCHNKMGKQFDMHPDVFVQNTVGKPTMAQSVEPPAGWLRVVPGDPEKSVLYVQARRTPLPMPNMAGGNRLRPMPPIGVADIAVDQEGLDALKMWILSLKK
jgi:hypothetical protein